MTLVEIWVFTKFGLISDFWKEFKDEKISFNVSATMEINMK